MDNKIELYKEVASQQYALDNCQDDINQLDKIKEAWEKGFDTANETFQFTLEDMKNCFKMARKEDWYYVLGDDEQHYKPKYEKFKDYLKKN